MRIRDFTSILNFAITNLNFEESGFEINFDEIMQRTAAYILKIVDEYKEESGKTELTKDDINTIILKDCDKIIDRTFNSSHIYLCSMKLIATKYLQSHNEIIPELLEEIKQKKLSFDEIEKYTDDFHQNLIFALLALEDDYKMYYKAIENNNSNFLQEVLECVEKFGKDEAFRNFCDKCNSIKSYSINDRRRNISFAYFVIYGIEGIDETKYDKKSPILKYKRMAGAKNYIDIYTDRLEESFRNEIVNSILNIISILDRFGDICDSIEIHNNKMEKINLPGLKYYVEEDKSTHDCPSIKTLLKPDNLKSQNVEDLLKMNSYYNNRLAKILDEYSKALFILYNTKETLKILEGYTINKNSLKPEVFGTLMIKYETLILVMKTFYIEFQKDAERNPKKYNKNLKNINLESDVGIGIKRKQIVLPIKNFVTDVKKEWKDEYTKYFDERLPGVDNSLKGDLELVNALYNPVFLSYKFKDSSLKCEYAYMLFQEKEKHKELNFGVVLESNYGNNQSNVQLASDGRTNFPNRLHAKRKEFLTREFFEFIKSYTDTPLIRLYEGYEDFFVNGEYISASLLLPVSNIHEKYIKNLRKGKTTNGKITSKNKKFVEHEEYLMDKSKFMPSHKIDSIKFDKKGNPINQPKQPIRYIDIRSGTIYLLNDDGKLVDENGKIFGENGAKGRING